MPAGASTRPSASGNQRAVPARVLPSACRRPSFEQQRIEEVRVAHAQVRGRCRRSGRGYRRPPAAPGPWSAASVAHCRTCRCGWRAAAGCAPGRRVPDVVVELRTLVPVRVGAVAHDLAVGRQDGVDGVDRPAAGGRPLARGSRGRRCCRPAARISCSWGRATVDGRRHLAFARPLAFDVGQRANGAPNLAGLGSRIGAAARAGCDAGVPGGAERCVRAPGAGPGAVASAAGRDQCRHRNGHKVQAKGR